MALNANDFNLLLQANRILSSKLDIDDVLQSVMELATKVVRAEVSSLLLLDEKKNELYFDVALGSATESIKQIRLKVGEGIAGWVAKERLPLIVNDVSKDKRFTVKVDKSTKFKTRSILAVPLMAKGKLVGVVEAINKEKEQDFTQEDQEAFSAFASQAAIAIENARLFSEVNREKEKLNTVFSEMSDGVVFLDEDQKIIILNLAASRCLDLDLGSAIGKKWGESLLPHFAFSPTLDNLGAPDEKFFPLELVRKKGKDLYLMALVRVLESTKEMPHGGSLILIRDITEERRGELLKRNFLSLMSHKLKTPLTVILGYAPALMSKMDGLDDFQKKALQSIYNQGQQLGGLVDKLLRFTIVESETLNRKMESKALKELLDNAVKDIDTLKKETKSVFEIDEAINSLPMIKVDGNLTTDVFKNLLENGIKFNDKEEKKIVIKASQKDKFVTIQFQDNGVGIPSEEKEKVFQKFYQIENSFTGQVPGAGLGLSLCKRVVEEMGGKILIESTLGEGTIVSVDLPCH